MLEVGTPDESPSSLSVRVLLKGLHSLGLWVSSSGKTDKISSSSGPGSSLNDIPLQSPAGRGLPDRAVNNLVSYHAHRLFAPRSEEREGTFRKG